MLCPYCLIKLQTSTRLCTGCQHQLAPEYVMLLGAWDIIPHQSLKNPALADRRSEDPDPLVPSDLPYACDAKLSSNVLTKNAKGEEQLAWQKLEQIAARLRGNPPPVPGKPDH